MYEIQFDALRHPKMAISRKVVCLCFYLDLNLLYSDSFASMLQDKDPGKKGLISVFASFSGRLLKLFSIHLVDFS